MPTRSAWRSRSSSTRCPRPSAGQAKLGGRLDAELHPALVNGAAGVVITIRGRPYAVMAFTVAGGRITEIDVIVDPERVGRVAAAVLAGG